MEVNVYAIVVTYNGEQFVRTCLNKLRLNECIRKIVVVDNGSTDNTRRILKENGEKILPIFNVENLGFGAANNMGIKLALEHGAEYILLVNQDLYVGDDTVSRLVDVIRSDDKIGICAPCQVDREGLLPDPGFKYHINRYTVDQFYGWNHRYNNSLLEVKFVNAAIWLFRSDIIKKVGGFNKLFFHYGEDEEYCRRISYFGYKIIVDMNNRVFHDRRASSLSNFKGSYYLERSKLYIELLDNRKSGVGKISKYVLYWVTNQWRYLISGNYRMASVYMRIALMFPILIYKAKKQVVEKFI